MHFSLGLDLRLVCETGCEITKYVYSGIVCQTQVTMKLPDKQDKQNM